MRSHIWLSVLFLVTWSSLAAPVANRTAAPPELPRELRALWIATKGNIDWPSKPGLPVGRQQQELRTLLELARGTGLNAVVLQVRPQGDALYESTLEPWSEYLTGREGVAPVPRWDPLEFAVREAHERGLELHAWINPFRAKSDSSRSPISPANFASRNPQLALVYGSQLWLNPGEPAVREHGLRVILDLVKRYDIDALHMDDYFYPYPIKDGAKGDVPFPDQRSFQRYGRGRSLTEWRRANVDDFVERAASAVHNSKSWVQFGVSPFGIWRPNVPPGIRGLDAYETLSADARRWLGEGWVDYLAPQLYWNIGQREQSFPVLMSWWASQNVRQRHLYAGIAPARIGTDRNAQEIASQIRMVQAQGGANGLMLWNAASLQSNKGGVTDLLRSTVLRYAALPPATPWRWTNAPVLLDFEVLPSGANEYRASWDIRDTEPVRQLGLQVRRGGVWSFDVLPPGRRELKFRVSTSLPAPEEIRLIPVGRAGIAGGAGTWKNY
jgi:uncharacterized lipoprotein YddW (UPF0748 family)